MTGQSNQPQVVSAPGEEVYSSYAVITPARNEGSLIEGTIRSMVAQTLKPIRWVIVSDGSTDGTDEIVLKYASEHDWIRLVRLPERKERHFAAKVKAFEAGYAEVKGLPYRFIASLDADITFAEGYFAFLLSKLEADPRLGLVGTPFEEAGRSYDYRYVSIEHVSGACQLFRRECFEEIGGYVPMRGGGVDHVAVLSARMKGWQTRTFTEMVCHHHRKQGTASHGLLRAKYRVGKLDYALGGHPLWELFRAAYQITQPPRILGGMMICAGYFWSCIRREQRPISEELIRFRRAEQMVRLRSFLGRLIPRFKRAAGARRALRDPRADSL